MDNVVRFNCDKYQALKNLWKSTRTIGMGFIHSHEEPTDEDVIKAFKYEDECGNIIEKNYIDYFKGRPIKTDFENFPVLKPSGYDRDAGVGTMQKVSENTAHQFSPTKKLSSDEIEKLVEKNPIEIHSVSNLTRTYTSPNNI